MEYSFGYGKRSVDIDIDEGNVISVLTPNEVALELTGVDEVIRSLRDPIDSAPLRDIVRPGERIAIVTSDITRPLPSYKILPAVLEELSRAGVADEDILIVFGLGSHEGHSEDRKRALVGDAVYDRVRCVDSDPDDCVRMGVTSSGTPVDVFRPVAQADRRICLGNIEFHYFAGYSGGAKAIMPGVSTRDAIQNNHSAMVRPEAAAGRLNDNPVREDIEEAGRISGIDFIVNVVLNEKKRSSDHFAGTRSRRIAPAARFSIRFIRSASRARRTSSSSLPAVFPRTSTCIRRKKRSITPATPSVTAGSSSGSPRAPKGSARRISRSG